MKDSIKVYMYPCMPSTSLHPRFDSTYGPVGISPLEKRATALSLGLFEADGRWCFSRRGQGLKIREDDPRVSQVLAFVVWSGQMSTVRWCLWYNRWASAFTTSVVGNTSFSVPSICCNCILGGLFCSSLCRLWRPSAQINREVVSWCQMEHDETFFSQTLLTHYYREWQCI